MPYLGNAYGVGATPGAGSSTGSGYNTSYIPGYSNLPQGITNAGQGAGNAYVTNVQPNQTVGYQLNNLLDENGQYIQQARQSGLDQSNDRGLLNSSIAAGNSQRAAIQSALPIAQQDASTYASAATTNANNLNSILSTGMNNRAQMAAAATSAGGQKYAAQLQFQNAQQQRDYEGNQAGLNRSFQDYMNQQQYGNSMNLAQFNLGGQLLQNSQNFNNSAFLNAMNNPFIMQNPQALGGFVDFANSTSNNYYNQLFGNSTGGSGSNGGTSPQWQENNQWYQTPDYSQQYGNGSYAGGGPQLPYGQQPSYQNGNGMSYYNGVYG
jgi:hypothetical protein